MVTSGGDQMKADEKLKILCMVKESKAMLAALRGTAIF